MRGRILIACIVAALLLPPLASAQGGDPATRPLVSVLPTSVDATEDRPFNVSVLLANPTDAPLTWALSFSAPEGTKVRYERWEVTVPARARVDVNATVLVTNATAHDARLAVTFLAQETGASAALAQRATKLQGRADLEVLLGTPPSATPSAATSSELANADPPSSSPGAEPWVIGAAAGFAALGVGAAAWASRRDWWPLLLALYTRLRRSSLLDHPVRARIVEAVRAHPSIAFGELARTVGIAAGQLTHHARMLEKGGILFSTTDGQTRRFHLVADGRVEAIAPLSERALALVRASPRRASDLARELGVSRQALHYHVKRLAARGELVARPDGRDLWLEAAPGTQAPSAPRDVART